MANHSSLPTQHPLRILSAHIKTFIVEASPDKIIYDLKSIAVIVLQETVPSHQQHDQAMKHNHVPHHFRHVLGRTEKIKLKNQIDFKRMQRRKRAENDH
jgi:hypothetical protein